MQKELFVRLRRSVDRLLDGRAGERAPPTLACSRNGRRVRLRVWREPLEARLRRPLPQRRAARRAPRTYRYRDRPPGHLATRHVRAGLVWRPRNPTLAASGRVRPPRRVSLLASARGLTTNGPKSLLLPWRRHHGGGANRRPAAVGDRGPAQRRHSHQLFRPCEHLGRGAPAPARVRPDAGRSGFAVQRLLLVVRDSADPGWHRARPAWRNDREPRWRLLMGRRFRGSRVRDWLRINLRGAYPARRCGGASLSRQFQGDRLLVPARRAREGDRDFRRRGEIL